MCCPWQAGASAASGGGARRRCGQPELVLRAENGKARPLIYIYIVNYMEGQP